MGLLVGHGSCIMGHGSLSAWVTGSWVNASDPLPALVVAYGCRWYARWMLEVHVWRDRIYRILDCRSTLSQSGFTILQLAVRLENLWVFGGWDELQPVVSRTAGLLAWTGIVRQHVRAQGFQRNLLERHSLRHGDVLRVWNRPLTIELWTRLKRHWGDTWRRFGGGYQPNSISVLFQYSVRINLLGYI